MQFVWTGLEIDSKHLMVGHELENSKCKIKTFMRTWKREQGLDGRLIKEKTVTVNDLDAVQYSLAYAIPHDYIPRTDFKSPNEIAQVLGLSDATMYFTLPISSDAVDNIEKMVAAAESPEDVPVAIARIGLISKQTPIPSWIVRAKLGLAALTRPKRPQHLQGRRK